MGCSPTTANEEKIRAFESGLPFRNISLDDYRERVTRLVSPEDKDQISIDRLHECFKDIPDFANMKKSDSLLYKILRSRFLKVNMGMLL
jgi:hypothetical protein